MHKDVKFNGTNSTSPLESSEVPKNKPKRTQNELEKRAADTHKSRNEAKE
jgi:hypothetical protein